MMVQNCRCRNRAGIKGEYGLGAGLTGAIGQRFDSGEDIKKLHHFFFNILTRG
jgi:hypothetical protein